MGKCVNLSCGKAINTKKILTKQAFIYIINKATKKNYSERSECHVKKNFST